MESAPDPRLEHVPPGDGLGPRLVGQRVVVRSRVPDETGPTGGPAFTDVLGVLESWEDDAITVRRRDGTLVQVDTALIVSGKSIPPEPKRRRRDDSSSATAETDDSAG